VLQWSRHGVRDSVACHTERVLQSVRGGWRMRRGGGTGSGWWTFGLRTPARGKKGDRAVWGKLGSFQNEDECEGSDPSHSNNQPTEIPETAFFSAATPTLPLKS
jgi:hypothetical protein